MVVEALKEHWYRSAGAKAKLGDVYQDQELICCREDGSIRPPDTFSSDFAKFARRIGLKVRLHDLRHSHATALLRESVHPKIVQELGRSTVAITLDLYSHIQPGMQEDAVAKFDTALRSAIEERWTKTARA
ncbi:MAG: hypothetical protein FJW37_05300 [Acidobacteria bacterium]|nr:hypothetical protein [Acidobacteriota bacterium]